MKCPALVCMMLICLSFPAWTKGSASSAAGDLDSIELDLDQAPAKAPPAKKAKAKPKTKKASRNETLDDVELDGEDVAVKTAPVATVASEKVSKEIEELLAISAKQETAKDYAGVVALLKPSMEKLPRSALLRLARAYRAQSDATNEALVLEVAVGKNPQDYATQTLLGDAYLKLKRYDVAGQAYAAARALNNRYRPAYEGEWKLFEQDDSKYEARTLVQDMIKVFGPDAKTTAALCRMYSGEDFLEKATEACRAAIDIDKKNPDNYVHLAMSLRDQSQKDEAQKLIDDAAKRFPASESVQVLAGEMKADAKNFADAYTYFKRAVAANGKSAKAQVGLGTSAFELQKHDEAIAAFKAACHLDRKTGREFRAAALTAKKNKDTKWLAYQTALEDCE